MRTIILCASGLLALSPAVLLRAQTVANPLAIGMPARLAPQVTPPQLMAFALLPDAPTPIAAMIGGEIASTSLPFCPESDSASQNSGPCLKTPDTYTRFLDSTRPLALTPGQKALLAVHNLKDPGNLITIVDTAAFTIGTNSHTAYGPGWRGFGKNLGVSLLQDTTGEFFGTFLIPSLTHEDPHYHRMPRASVPRRFVHALSRTLIAQRDDGTNMPNYSSLLTNPICAEISNLYVPGIHGNGPSTVARIMTGYATEPIDNLITEFLPDLAKHIHFHVIFVQRILNQVASDEYSLP